MTGPELLIEGLQILADAKDADSDANPNEIELLLRFATAHLLGALVAATAESGRLSQNATGKNPTSWWTALHAGEGR